MTSPATTETTTTTHSLLSSLLSTITVTAIMAGSPSSLQVTDNEVVVFVQKRKRKQKNITDMIAKKNKTSRI